VKKQWSNFNLLIIGITIGIVCLLPSVIQNSFMVYMLLLIFFWALLGEAWNIIGGFAGQLSLGHAAYFGIGAYTSTLLSINYGVSPWLGMIVGGFLAMISAVAVGYPCFRLKEVYYSLATIVFGEMMRLTFISELARPWTGGAQGLIIQIKDNPLQFQFTNYEPYYYLIFAMMLASIFISYMIMNSKFGLDLLAIRDDEDAAKSLGIDTQKAKLKASAISAFLAGIAGTFYAQFFGYIDPNATMSYVISLQIVLVTLIGGKATVMGPILGSIVMTPIDAYTSMMLGGTYQGLHLMAYGMVIVVIVMLKPQGLIVLTGRVFERMQALIRQTPADRSGV